MRYLGIDLGDRRTGLALGDSITRLCSPLTVLQVPLADDSGNALLRALAREIDTHVGRSPCHLVLGLPLNMDGTESPRSKLVRAFAVKLAAVVSREVHLQDERLTSSEADWAMAQSGLTHKQKKARRDAIAAAAILQDFLDAQAQPPTP